MTAYFVAQFTVLNKEALVSYSGKAGPVIASFGGSLIFKSMAGETLNGDNPHKGIAVFSFPDQETLKRCHDSAEYQALVEERRQGADMVLSGYEAA